MAENLLRTPLYESHKQLGARMVSFGGWEMPVQYSGVINEHVNVRTKVGLFDVSHMGEIRLTGKDTKEFLNYVLSNDVSKLIPGAAQYTVLLTEEGTAVDDLIVYKMDESEYFLCVNASNIEKDFKWLTEHNNFDVKIENVSDDYALIAVQGPNATLLVETFLDRSLQHLKPFNHEKLNANFNGTSLTGFIARTGYTGENGYELFISASQGRLVWDGLLKYQAEYGVLPIGLGARDSLRLEAALCLYGHELKEDIDILSAGLGWVTKFNKPDFIGREALISIRNNGPRYKLVGLELIEPGIARELAPVIDTSGKEVGFVTSGTKTPTVNKAIALAYISTSALNESESSFSCVVRDKPIRVKIVPTPFYKRA